MFLKFVIVAAIASTVAACGGENGGAGRTSGTAQLDPVSDRIYNDLMTKAESGVIADSSYNSVVKVGDTNPYRSGNNPYQFKAMAMCLDWNIEKAEVKRKWFQVSTGDDWGYVAFRADKACEEQQRQRNLECNCQLVDHDDKNVLEVPAEFRQAYEQKTN